MYTLYSNFYTEHVMGCVHHPSSGSISFNDHETWIFLISDFINEFEKIDSYHWNEPLPSIQNGSVVLGTRWRVKPSAISDLSNIFKKRKFTLFHGTKTLQTRSFLQSGILPSSINRLKVISPGYSPPNAEAFRDEGVGCYVFDDKVLHEGSWRHYLSFGSEKLYQDAGIVNSGVPTVFATEVAGFSLDQSSLNAVAEACITRYHQIRHGMVFTTLETEVRISEAMIIKSHYHPNLILDTQYYVVSAERCCDLCCDFRPRSFFRS